MNEDLINETVDNLLDFNASKPLSHFVTFNGNRIRYTNTPDNEKGLYAFWLTNNDGDVERLNRSLEIKGPGNIPKTFTWDWNVNEKYILVYIGKTTTFKSRLTQHLKLKTFSWEIPEEKTSPYKLTTSCQLRTGIEHLLTAKNQPNNQGLDFIKERIQVSYIPLDGLGNRFFAEDLAIGKGKPWFNVDSER
ncbi:hypothetical protein [Lacinutrix chionoecetis]